MARRDRFLTSRRLMIASVIFGLFVLFDISLFGWLIGNSLSQRELEKVLLETREEAEPLAERLVEEAEALGHEDLWVVVSSAQETQTYIQSVLAKRDLVHKVEIQDRNGTVVFTKVNEQSTPLGREITEAPPIEISELPKVLPPEIVPTETVEVPIGNLGTLVIGLSEEAVQKRIGVLRQDLVRQAWVIGVLTLLLLAIAYAAIWKLFLRSRRLEEQAVEAERMAYIGTLASGLAHEIRSPLNSLNLNMQMLEEEANDGGLSGASSARLLSLTRSEISRLERLATDFLSYAKPRPAELEEVPVGELLRRVTTVLGAEIQALEATVTVNDEARGARVRVDPAQMEQLLLNLIQNALNATEQASRPPEVELRARRQGSQGVIEVIDNGVGIAPEDVDKVFDLFYSTRRGGTGLGLAIVQRIASAHGGELEVESTLGEGSTLRLRLPLASRGEAETTEVRETSAARAQGAA